MVGTHLLWRPLESHRRNLETPEAFAAVLREEFALAGPDDDLHEMLMAG
jgi:hypothetical protein